MNRQNPGRKVSAKKASRFGTMTRGMRWRLVEAQQDVIEQERLRAESVLLNILPERIVERLKVSPGTIVDYFDDATVVFIDIVDFTKLSQTVGPEELVGMLNEVFTKFDHVSRTHGLEKIKTIGDAYMAVSGVPKTAADHAEVAALAALEFRSVAESIRDPLGNRVRVRIGVSSGPVIAGVIGVHKFAYDLWGDTVNTSSRMEHHSEPGKILVSPTIYAHISARFQLRRRAAIEVKGIGPMKTYWLEGVAPTAVKALDESGGAGGAA